VLRGQDPVQVALLALSDKARRVGADALEWRFFPELENATTPHWLRQETERLALRVFSLDYYLPRSHTRHHSTEVHAAGELRPSVALNSKSTSMRKRIMKNLSRSHAFATSFRTSFLCAVAVLLLASAASAARITYTGFTITDGQLGSWKFHNAQVYLSFESDTSHVQLTQIQGVNVAYIGPFPPQQLCTGPASAIGTAQVSIISGEKRVRATFAPNQLFVSLDLDNGGVGFGSCGPNGFELTVLPKYLKSWRDNPSPPWLFPNLRNKPYGLDEGLMFKLWRSWTD